MNIVSVVRFVGNFCVAVGFIFVIFVIIPNLAPGSGSAWGVAFFLFALAMIGGFAPVIAGLFRPKEARAAWDEQVNLSHLRSYVFGYWVVMAVFLGQLVLVLGGALSGAEAFFMMGLPLAVAPAAYMVWAYLTGRAG